MVMKNWSDSPQSAVAIRLLKDVHNARSFGELDEALAAARVWFARQAMHEWEFLGIRKWARIQRELLGDDLAKGRVPATEGARHLAAQNRGSIVRKVVTSYTTSPLPSGWGFDITGSRRRV